MDPAFVALAIVLAFVIGVLTGVWSVLRLFGGD